MRNDAEIDPRSLREIIETNYREVGFDAIGAVSFELLGDHTQCLKEWLAKGFHGNMEYMARWSDIRGDLRALLPGVKSVAVTLTSYANIPRQLPDTPRIARFARAEDYHSVVKRRLNRLLGRIRERYPSVRGRAVVDSAPAFEKAWAVKAGLGWIGRSSLLINPGLGSRTVIGMLLLDQGVEPCGPFTENLCGKCRKCITGCPTGAINDNRTIDARKCLSYQTVRTGIAEQAGGWIFGCDCCIDACPFNKVEADVVKGLPHYEVEMPGSGEWLAMNEAEFQERFGKTPLALTGLERIKSNVRAACKYGK